MIDLRWIDLEFHVLHTFHKFQKGNSLNNWRSDKNIFLKKASFLIVLMNMRIQRIILTNFPWLNFKIKIKHICNTHARNTYTKKLSINLFLSFRPFLNPPSYHSYIHETNKFHQHLRSSSKLKIYHHNHCKPIVQTFWNKNIKKRDEAVSIPGRK